MVPEGWKAGTVLDFFKLQRGFDITKAQTEPGSVPVYSSSGISYYHSKSMAVAPGVVTGRKGSVGSVFFVNQPFWPHDTTLWVCDFKGSHEKYVWYFLKSLELEKLDEASSVPTLNRNNVHRLRCVFPPLPEQQKIAEILGTWDKAIKTTEALLANARTQKRALMQSLLTGTRRFPGFEEHPWREVRLGDVCDTWSGGTPSRLNPEYFGGTIPWIMSGEVNAARVLVTEETITEKALKDSAAKMVEPETVLVAMYGATAGVVSVSGIHAAINQAILAVKARTEVNQTYLLFAIQGKMEETKRLTQGGQPNLNAQIIRAAMIGMPSEAEQIRIAEILMHAEAEVSSTAISLDHLRTEKKSLMQQLLTGKRRVVSHE